ncbi:MAG: acyl--CoA ligase [Gammaproteobacteria bacterium]|nr:acyl--CoA ligase [Gammaproteobacteria bacterium]
MLRCRTDPGAPALIDCDGTQLRNGDLYAAVAAATDLLRENGVVAADRVLLVAENCAVFIAVALACSRLGAWVVPVNARMTSTEIARIAAHSEPRLQIFTHAVSPAALAHGKTARAGEVSLCDSLKLLVSEPDRRVHPQTDAASATQVAALMYTTGTTGDPKGVMLTHANLLYASWASIQIRAIDDRDHIYGVLPFTHIFAFNSAFLAALRAGAKIQLVARFDPADFFAALAGGVTLVPAVPAMYARLLEYAQRTGIESPDAPRLRYMSAGGAPLDPDWKHRVEKFFGLCLHNGYGLTESTAGICSTRVGDERDDISVGPPMPGQDVRIAAAPDHDEVRDGVGEIVVKGPNVMLGYYKNRKDTARVIDSDGYLHTGDLGRFDRQGCLHIVGRRKELIIRSGFNVYPPEVETAINAHPDVVHAAVIGQRESDGNEKVLAFVERAPYATVDEAALQAFIKNQLAPYKRPARIVVTDALPLSTAGKVLKYRLLDVFGAQLKNE